MPTVSFDGKTWYRLASIAEGQGVTIAQLLAQAAGAVRAGPRPLTLAGEIRAAKYAAKSEVVAAEVVHAEAVEDDVRAQHAVAHLCVRLCPPPRYATLVHTAEI